ncbi:MAG: trigger factor [Candidatus Coatesbacteria bacterium]|nr:trigger factor [Candidatus Coatesbacteria bacterium]
MRITKESKEGELHVFEVEISPEEVNQEFNRAFSRYRQSIAVPGFRKGKAPKGAVKRKFGSKILQEVQDSLINAYTREAIEMRNLTLTDRPKVEPLVSLEEGKPFSFRLDITADFVPEIRGYDEIRIQMPPKRLVTDGDMDRMLKNLRERYATLRPVEGPETQVEVNDRIIVDAAFLGQDTKEVLISAADEMIEVQSAETHLWGIKLVGLKPDEEAISDYVVPETFSDEDLRGKTVLAKLKVKEIKKLEYPPLDDSFAKMTGEADSLDTLKEILSKELQAQYDQAHAARSEEMMFERLLNDNPFVVNPSLLKRRVISSVATMAQRGMIRKDISEDEFKEFVDNMEPVVLETMKREALLGQIAFQEKMEPSPDELKEAIKKSNMRPKSGPNDTEYLMDLIRIRLDVRRRLIEEKARQFLLEHLKIEYVAETAEEEQPEETESEDKTD